MWTPDLIIVNKDVINTRITQNIIAISKTATVKETYSGKSDDIKKIILSYYGYLPSFLDKFQRGKRVVYLSPVTNNDVDLYNIKDSRLTCPQFFRIKLASNGCPFMCDWCYLKHTFGWSRPYITIKAESQKLYDIINKRIFSYDKPILFNCGELNDSLALEHLTLFAQTFIPRFSYLRNGYLYLLTKSDNVDAILGIDHKNHTTIGWSMNAPIVSEHFELGAPSFERRLMAAKKVQDSKYNVRIRIDPIIKFNGWEEAYLNMINKLFTTINPTRITLGTLRFEKKYYDNRDSMFLKPNELLPIVNRMVPMLEAKVINGESSIGKYSFEESERKEVFQFIISEVRKYSTAPIALCKETKEVWDALGLDMSKIQCVCQI